MTLTSILLLLLVGILAGTLSGMVGVGGGIIIVPALVLVMAMDQKLAQGTSLVVILLPTGIFAVMNYYKQGYIDITSALWVAAGFVLGGYLGSKLALSLPAETVRRIFGVVLVLVALKFILNK